MTVSDETRQEIATLRERYEKLHAASLCISMSLDLDTVLREIVDSGRALIGARCGLITTVDDAGEVEEFIASGLTDDERRQLEEWPYANAFFQHLRDLQGALRLVDLADYIHSHGYSEEFTLPKTLQAMPMRHRGAHVGNFFLGGKEGGQAVTEEDEEVLVLFASQAAAAIANARTHRDEQLARADLEALVDALPVGMVVFDAPSVRPVSFNREARRLAGKLRGPDASPEQLLEVLVCRPGDGREIQLDEYLSTEFHGAETVRVEEVRLSVPEGQSVTVLINATPVQSASGVVESVMVTLQDLEPLDKLDRLRVEFLGLVSHELRAPLTSIKGSIATMMAGAADLDPAEMREYLRIIDDQSDHMRGLISDLLDIGRIDTGMLSVSPEPMEVARLVDRARNTFLSGDGQQRILIDLPPNLPFVMAEQRRIVQVLNNLFSNAARQAPESSTIRVIALHKDAYVAISVIDEGRGIAPEVLPHLFRKHGGLTGNDREGALGATGLGLAICKGLVESHGGLIWAASGGVGQGTEVTFTLPVAEVASENTATGSSPAQLPAPRDRPKQIPVLVVDDDPGTLRHMRDALAGSEYTPMVTGDPREISRLIRAEKPGLVLLDLMLPGEDGIALMGRVPELADLPVIFISGYGRDETIARALEAGAVDYIVKPISATELKARIRVALRRRPEPEPYVLDDLIIYYEERRVSVSGRAIELTATEYELLRVLSSNAGRVSTYEVLGRQVWGGRYYRDRELIRTFVKKLRRKLGDDAACPAYIVNERGVGYRMARLEDA